MSEAPPPTTPFDMGASRLEAFSDAVMAVIITLLAFELEPPAAVSRAALREALPGLFIYVLSFLFIAIYWNNHHHLLRTSDRISAATMWANMLLLFCLSLIPVSAEWMRSAAHEHLDPRGPAAFFGIVGLAAALSYTWLVRALIRANGRDSGLARAIHTDVKGRVSLALYAAGVALAGLSASLSYVCYAAVSVIWLIPDRRLTHTHDDEPDPRQ